MKQLVVTALILGVIAATAWATDVTGKWIGGGRGIWLTFTFRQEGIKVTGLVKSSTGESIAIVDGRIEDGRLRFTVRIDGEDPLQFVITGTVRGDEMELSAKAEGAGISGGGSMILRREP
jgi:hypothetical protein